MENTVKEKFRWTFEYNIKDGNHHWFNGYFKNMYGYHPDWKFLGYFFGTIDEALVEIEQRTQEYLKQ